MKDGGYFIYKDSVTSAIDSFWSSNFRTGVSEVSLQSNPYFMEFIMYDLQSTTNGYYTISMQAGSNGISYNYRTRGNFYGSLMLDPFEIKMVNINRGFTSFKQLHQHFAVNNVTYDSVYEIGNFYVNEYNDTPNSAALL